MSIFTRGAEGFEHTEANRREVLLAAGGVAAATALAGHTTGRAIEKKVPAAKRSGAVIDDPAFSPFEVLAWSWGASNSGTTHMGGGGGAGKANVQDLSLTKYVDTNSPRLFAAVATGRHFDRVTLTWISKGAPTMTMLLEEVLVTSMSTGGSAGEQAPTENITFNFAKITFSVGAVDAGYDIAGNA